MPPAEQPRRETSMAIERRLEVVAAARKASGGFRLSDSDCWGVPGGGTLTNYQGEQVKEHTRGLRLPRSRPKNVDRLLKSR